MQFSSPTNKTITKKFWEQLMLIKASLLLAILLGIGAPNNFRPHELMAWPLEPSQTFTRSRPTPLNKMSQQKFRDCKLLYPFSRPISSGVGKICFVLQRKSAFNFVSGSQAKSAAEVKSVSSAVGKNKINFVSGAFFWPNLEIDFVKVKPISA